jgi:uncharacterized protein YcaQ
MATVHKLSRPDARRAAVRKAGMLRINAVHQDVPFTREMSAAVDTKIASLAAWLGLEQLRAR